MNADEGGVGVKVELDVPTAADDHVYENAGILMVWTGVVVGTAAFPQYLGHLRSTHLADLKQVLVFDVRTTLVREIAGKQGCHYPAFDLSKSHCGTHLIRYLSYGQPALIGEASSSPSRCKARPPLGHWRDSHPAHTKARENRSRLQQSLTRNAPHGATWQGEKRLTSGEVQSRNIMGTPPSNYRSPFFRLLVLWARTHSGYHAPDARPYRKAPNDGSEQAPYPADRKSVV